MHSRRGKRTGLGSRRSYLILAGPLVALNFLSWKPRGGGPVCSQASQPHSSINKSLSRIMPWFTSQLPSVPFRSYRQLQVDWACSAPLSRERPDSYNPYSVTSHSCIISVNRPCPFTSILGFIQRLLNLHFNLDASFYKAIWSYKR